MSLALFTTGCLQSLDSHTADGAGDMAMTGATGGGGAGGGAGHPTGGAGVGGSGGAGTAKAYFDPDIQQDLDRLGCTNGSCHGGPYSPELSAAPATAIAYQANYNDIKVDCTTLDCLGGGANALLLTKPLMGSSAAHSGTKPFASTADATYQRWLAWINAGAPYSAAGPPVPPDMALPPSTDMARSNESMTITFTTSASPSGKGSRFAPKNVVAVWIETSAGVLVKTIGRFANIRRNQLIDWYGKAGINDMDAISSATQPKYGTLTAKWDMTARAGFAAPPDGTYTIRLELADDDVSAANQNNQGTFTFARNGKASSQANLTNGGFSSVSIVYTGR